MADLLRNKLPKFLLDLDPNIYLGGNYVILDFETTNLDKGTALNPRNSIVSVGYGLGPNHPNNRGRDIHESRISYVRANEYELGGLVSDIEQAQFCVAHNAKFELQWLERCGLDISKVLVFDTMLAEYVIGGNRWRWAQVGLDAISRRRFGSFKTAAVSMLIKAGVCPSEIPETWLEKYCIKDVELTWDIFEQQLIELQKLNLLAVAYCRNLLTPVLADIEKNGMQLDGEKVLPYLEQIELEYGKIGAELDQMTGGISITSRLELADYLYEKLKFTERMKKQHGRWVLDRTPSGQKKTDADTIEALRPNTKEQKRFIALYTRHKELYNELTKYLRKFGDCVREVGGNLSASFNQTATQTHRLSSSGRNYTTQLHNIPRAYKPLFRARRKGWLVGEGDGAQLEFRTAVHMGRDPVGLSDIEQGTDIHSVTAGVIGCSRQDAKPHTFKPLYGGQSGTPDEKRYYRFFREKYTDITATQQKWIDEVLNTGKLRTEWGMIYYWPNTRMDNSGYVTNTTSICNYPVQALATAEIIPLALVFFWHRLRVSDYQMFIINTVHDSIICELPPEEVEAFHDLCRQCLIDDVYYAMRRLYGVALTVPLGAGVKAGTHWNGPDCKDWVPEGITHDKGEVVYTAPFEMYNVTNE